MRPLRLHTERLELVAATPESEHAAGKGRDELAAHLRARATQAWPPPLAEDVQGVWETLLREDPQAHGWTSWYWLLLEPDAAPLLVGYGGFKGRPANGACEVGYSVIESHHRRGLATEGTRALVDWAFTHDDVQLVSAHTLPDLVPSIGVLDKLGFSCAGAGEEEGTLRYELRRPRAVL